MTTTTGRDAPPRSGRRTTIRAGVAALAGVELVLGAWNLLAPESFYRDVPTVDLTPPYSEHLFRDFGGATLGLALVLAAAAVWMERRVVVLALLAYLAFSAPHLAFHQGHLHGATDLEAAVLTVLLAGSVALPAALVVLTLTALRRPSDAGPDEL
jgi:hypothetical protein